jgi:hypothetical protein
MWRMGCFGHLLSALPNTEVVDCTRFSWRCYKQHRWTFLHARPMMGAREKCHKWSYDAIVIGLGWSLWCGTEDLIYGSWVLIVLPRAVIQLWGDGVGVHISEPRKTMYSVTVRQGHHVIRWGAGGSLTYADFPVPGKFIGRWIWHLHFSATTWIFMLLFNTAQVMGINWKCNSKTIPQKGDHLNIAPAHGNTWSLSANSQRSSVEE